MNSIRVWTNQVSNSIKLHWDLGFCRTLTTYCTVFKFSLKYWNAHSNVNHFSVFWIISLVRLVLNLEMFHMATPRSFRRHSLYVTCSSLFLSKQVIKRRHGWGEWKIKINVYSNHRLLKSSHNYSETFRSTDISIFNWYNGFTSIYSV